MDKDKITIIGIAGGTGSGKTTVVRKIVEALPPHFVAVVPLDSYYNDTTGMTDEERHAINFDHPDAFDWKLLHKQLNDLRNGKAIEQPTYSYLKCNREAETIHVEPKPVLTAGQLATRIFSEHYRITATPPMGGYVEFGFEGRTLRLYRMPSSSRDYPLAVEKKAEYYRKMFEDVL